MSELTLNNLRQVFATIEVGDEIDHIALNEPDFGLDDWEQWCDHLSDLALNDDVLRLDELHRRLFEHVQERNRLLAAMSEPQVLIHRKRDLSSTMWVKASNADRFLQSGWQRLG